MKCCICGTVRNCGPYLDKVLSNMEKIGELFDDYVIIVYYDISVDNTLKKLQNYQIKNSKLILHINQNKLLKYRTHRISLGRNKCLDIMRRQYNDYKYFIMMDCDDKCAYNININLLKENLKRDDWDSLSFNHPAGYYDTWAFSKRPFVLSCYNSKVWEGKRYITSIIKQTPKTALIKCMSAFNGFAIYRTDKFNNCYYDGTARIDYIPKKLIRENVSVCGPIIQDKQHPYEDCEHRFFHINAIKKNNARIRIAPVCLFT